PQTPCPVMRIAPKGMRLTSLSPSRNVPDVFAVVTRKCNSYPHPTDRKHGTGDDEVGVVLDRRLDADEHDAQSEDPTPQRRDQPVADQADLQDQEPDDPRQPAHVVLQ